jgi:hypothetical protein
MLRIRPGLSFFFATLLEAARCKSMALLQINVMDHENLSFAYGYTTFSRRLVNSRLARLTAHQVKKSVKANI